MYSIIYLDHDTDQRENYVLKSADVSFSTNKHKRVLSQLKGTAWTITIK